jgi:RNA methyltransferase, TrmH family
MLVKSQVKYIQSLGQKKQRNIDKLFIAEGPKLVQELINSGAAQIKQIFALADWVNEDPKNKNYETIIVTESELERISQLSTPNKVLAIVEQFPVAESINVKNSIVPVLDRIQDPGNFGTIIRIADWFGIKQIVCSPDCADLYNPKVIQATMGSIARVQVIYTDLYELLQNENSPVYATALEGEDIRSVNRISEGFLLFGNESKGIDPSLLTLATSKITIPRFGKAESLNAAIAAGIVISHIVKREA